MGFKQTPTHKNGKGSYHQIGLVRGQFGNVPMDKWVKFVKDAGFDGWEEASWELDLRKCDTDAGAAAYAKERVALAKKHGLEIFTVATHLQGQALGDEPSAKTLQFIGGEAVAAYKAWRDKGNKPPRTDPYFVPDEVGKLRPRSRRSRTCWRACGWRTTSASCRTARWRCPASSARRPIAGAISSCSRRCRPSIGGHAIPDVRQVSLELLVERFGPVWDLCKKYGVTFDLECHPSERAMGDIESASDYINFLCKAGYEGVVGFNLDGSHMEWQGVSVVQFIREFGEYIHCAHIKGVQVIRGAHPRRPAGRPSADGPSAQRLELRDGRHGPRRQQRRGDHDRAEPRRLRRGGVSIEWEDNDAEQHAGAKAALANVRTADLPPSGMRHDEMLKA